MCLNTIIQLRFTFKHRTARTHTRTHTSRSQLKTIHFETVVSVLYRSPNKTIDIYDR